ncbi:uncharacterized protein [Argopecten irradians]|uniref:uncharacterized protein isoform X4 n=1 Tax=Argopecten irradians TaxID=31199 RepID=UPI00371E28B7
MAECAYHMEARRLQAIHDRKQMALKRCMEQQSQNMSGEVQEKMATKSATMFSGADNFDTKRCSRLALHKLEPEDGVVFKEVVHDPNFVYRSLKERKNLLTTQMQLQTMNFQQGSSQTLGNRKRNL